jgi:murein L,D-transpeptidase YafK
MKGKCTNTSRVLRQTKILLEVVGVLIMSVSFLASCSSTPDSKEERLISKKVATCVPTKRAKLEENLPYKKVDQSFPLSAVRNPEIYVYKGKRKLLVVQGDVLVRDYEIGLGNSPRGDKQRQGDGRTPEGKFSVCTKNHGSKYYKSVGLDYPTRKHAEQALFSGEISPDEYRIIVQALRARKLPPWTTSMGGAIFIHGGGNQADWTEGCVALNNRDMDELFSMVFVGTPVHVMP